VILESLKSIPHIKISEKKLKKLKVKKEMIIMKKKKKKKKKK